MNMRMLKRGAKTCNIVLLVEFVGGLHGRGGCEKAAGESEVAIFA